MTYTEARFQAWAYTIIGHVLFVFSVLIVLISAIKSLYYGCGSFGACQLVKPPIELAYGELLFIRWVWQWLPDVPPDLWFMALFSSAGLCAAFFFVFALFVGKSGFQLRKLLIEARNDAIKRSIIDSYIPGNATQSIGSIQAGGDVSINQAINNNPAIRKWNKSFYKSPIGLIIIATVGGTLTLVIGRVLGLG